MKKKDNKEKKQKDGINLFIVIKWKFVSIVSAAT